LKTVVVVTLVLIAGGCGANKLELVPVPEAEAVGVFHTVQEGETLYSICWAYGVDLQEVMEVNGMEENALLRAGQTIFIPEAKKEIHLKTKTPEKAEEKPPTKLSPPPEKSRFIWPVEGTISSLFGVRDGRRHDGLDIAAPEGTTIRAAADGEVIFSGNQGTGYGNLLIIRHADNFITIYAHCLRNLVREGDRVEQGQEIALVGRTGRASGPHLHFEIREGVKPRNPLFFLPRKTQGGE
jgi:lipoprotein NlpD